MIGSFLTSEAALADPEDTGINRTHAPVAALAEVLRQLTAVIQSLTDEQFAAAPVGVFPSSIGGHVRHCLDHVAALLRGAESGCLNYDDRKRGTDVETDRRIALDETRRLEREVVRACAQRPDRPISLTSLLTAAGPAVDVHTSLSRELTFVLSHTIHHNAVIAAMARTLGADVPPSFGYAPATLSFLQRAQCAPSPSCR